jgi:hypothetical protein
VCVLGIFKKHRDLLSSLIFLLFFSQTIKAILSVC